LGEKQDIADLRVEMHRTFRTHLLALTGIIVAR
jgi:hypothetical protein